MTALTLALPSKGRLKEQVERWLADCGLPLSAGGRAYAAGLTGFPEIEVRLMPAAEVAAALASGEVHFGLTGEDLLREGGEDLEAHTLLLLAPGFGRADLVLAAPRSWIDVATVADLEEVAHEHLARTGRRLRVATKYAVQTRRFFARHGLVDYRIVESAGATEGAPAAGLAEVVVDITTTGATLEANHLKRLEDGLILRSQAQLAAGLRAPWSQAALAAARRLLGVLEARARAKETLTLVWPADQDGRAREALAAFGREADWRTSGLLVPADKLFGAAAALAEAGVGPVTVTRPEYVFAPASEAADRLADRLSA
ncbi:MAG: ATP phosphoribosyltransferase [Pseudomonadota bacterium]|nr:ATP phosphoribosyltransferase [Pseudomonadota bacterium]